MPEPIKPNSTPLPGSLPDFEVDFEDADWNDLAAIPPEMLLDPVHAGCGTCASVDACPTGSHGVNPLGSEEAEDLAAFFAGEDR